MNEHLRNQDSIINDEIVEQALVGILSGDWDTENSALECTRVRTFRQAGVLTYDRGLVITLPDGTEYQLTIVRSR